MDYGAPLAAMVAALKLESSLVQTRGGRGTGWERWRRVQGYSLSKESNRSGQALQIDG